MTALIPHPATLAALLARLDAAEDVPLPKRRQLACAAQRIADGIGLPPESLPATWAALRERVERLHHVPLGISARTLANYRASLRAALTWFGASPWPVTKQPLEPAWAALLAGVEEAGLRGCWLSSLIRYCSTQGISPTAVDEAVLDAYIDHRARTTALRSGRAVRRRIARAWNACCGIVPGWPATLLSFPAHRQGPDWELFPETLRQEFETYFTRLAKPHRTADGKRLKGAKASTILSRRRELVAYARQAVGLGVPVAQLTSLAALLDPALAERVLDARWEADGEIPKTYTIDLSCRLHAMARQTGCLDADALAALDDLRAELESYRQGGLTAKNRAVIRQVLTSPVWSEVVSLPERLMRQARQLAKTDRLSAARLAQSAVAVGMLIFAPVRIGNLAATQIGENLIRPGGPDSPYWLVYPEHDVKNRVELQFKFDEALSDLIHTYVTEHRPALLRGSNEPFLFPGQNGGHKTTHWLSIQIGDIIEKHTGLEISAHQMRHVAGALILEHHPGNYELARRVLGHKRVETTMRSYVGLETLQATQTFAGIVREVMSEKAATAPRRLA